MAMKNKKTAMRLREALAKKQMSAAELAKRSGVSKASISQYYNGTHTPSNISSAKMAEVLDVNALWLMGFDLPKPEITLSYGDDDIFIEAYDSLNEEGFNRLMEYAKFLMSSGRYRKD